jgi:hypothetical protein
MCAEPREPREFIKAIAAVSVTLRPDGLPLNAVPIALMMPRIRVTNPNRRSALSECFCFIFECVGLAQSICIGAIKNSEMHRNASTDKTAKITRNILCASHSKLTQ